MKSFGPRKLPETSGWRRSPPVTPSGEFLRLTFLVKRLSKDPNLFLSHLLQHIHWYSMVYYLKKSPLPRSSGNLFLTVLSLLLGSMDETADVNHRKLHLLDDGRDGEAKGYFRNISFCVCDLIIQKGFVYFVEWWIHENH